jgi:hypothetical protein
MVVEDRLDERGPTAKEGNANARLHRMRRKKCKTVTPTSTWRSYPLGQVASQRPMLDDERVRGYRWR